MNAMTTTLELPRDFVAPYIAALDLASLPRTTYERLIERESSAQLNDLLFATALATILALVALALVV